jgi:outer membrane lipoprotein-sorting protein
MLFFSPPDRMRWDYEGKMPHKVVINGSLVWMYTPSRKQVVKRNMTPEEMRRGPATFLSGLGAVEEDFRIQSRPVAAGEAYDLDLFPVSEETSFEKISLTIAPETGLVERISIHHKLGNVTTITFHDFNTKADLTDSVFGWDVPEGTEVVEP